MGWRQRHRCPSEEALAQLAGGDLPVRRATSLRTHLEQCDPCRTRARAIADTLALYRASMEADDRVPQWRTFQPALVAQDTAWRRAQVGATRRWSSAAAVLLMAATAAWWYQRVEVPLSAAQVLTRSLAHEAQQPAHARVPVRIAQATAIPDAAARDADLALATSRDLQPFDRLIARDHAGAELARRLAPYAFEASSPLSVRHFQRWRDTTQPHDEPVRWLAGDLVQIAASSPGGAIRRAEITIRTTGYQPVAQAWHFADGFAIEVTSVPASPDTAPRVPATPTAPRAATAPPKEPAPEPLELLELDTRLALLRWGAPVGDLTIRRSGQGLRLDGVTTSAQLVRELDAYARSQSAITTRVRLGAKREADSPPTVGLQPWLDRTFSDAITRDAFASRAWTLVDALRASGLALAALADRYPVDTARHFPPPAAAKLTQLIDAQYAQVAREFEALERHLSPLTGTLSRAVLPDKAPTEWRVGVGPIRQPLDDLTRTFQALCEQPAAASAREVEDAARRQLRPTLEALAATLAGESSP